MAIGSEERSSLCWRAADYGLHRPGAQSTGGSVDKALLSTLQHKAQSLQTAFSISRRVERTTEDKVVRYYAAPLIEAEPLFERMSP